MVGVVYDVNYQLTYLQLYGIQQTLQVIILPLASQIHQMHHRTHQIHCHFHGLILVCRIRMPVSIASSAAASKWLGSNANCSAGTVGLADEALSDTFLDYLFLPLPFFPLICAFFFPSAAMTPKVARIASLKM